MEAREINQIKKRVQVENNSDNYRVDDAADDLSKRQIIHQLRCDPLYTKAYRIIAVTIWVIVMTVFIWIVAPISLFIIKPLMRLVGLRIYYSPVEVLSRVWARVLCWLWGIKVRVEGKENVLACEGRPTVMMYSHCSNIDPIVLLGYTATPARYIFKKELFYFVPFVFLLGYLIGHIPINRKKRDAAFQSINEAAESIRRNNACVVISPEGTRSPDGRLKPFKKGPFHMAVDSKAQVLPACVFGNHEVWPVSYHLPNSGFVHIRYLPAFKVKGDDIDALSSKTREVMLKSLIAPPSDFTPYPHPPPLLPTTIFLTIFSIVCFIVYQYIPPQPLNLIFNNLSNLIF